MFFARPSALHTSIETKSQEGYKIGRIGRERVRGRATSATDWRPTAVSIGAACHASRIDRLIYPFPPVSRLDYGRYARRLSIARHLAGHLLSTRLVYGISKHQHGGQKYGQWCEKVL